MSSLSPLQTAVLRTLAYFDVFDYPLTLDELRRWLCPEPGAALHDVDTTVIKQAVGQLMSIGRIERQGQYVFLIGRSDIVRTREERRQANRKKWRRALAAARFLEIIPFVKLVAVVNTLALGNAGPASDIDFLIITGVKHIWLTRLMVTGVVSLLGYRRHGDKITDRVCLSFYATTDGLDFSGLRLAPRDPHLTFWTAQAVPLMDDGAYERFVAANAWVKDFLPFAWDWDWRSRLLRPSGLFRSIKHGLEGGLSASFSQPLESWARDYQLKRMEKNTRSKAGLGTTEVVISEDILKFHEDDRRGRYNQAWRKRLAGLGLKPD